MKKINWKDEKKKAYWKNIILFRWDKLIQKRDKHQWVFGGREGKNFDDNSRHLFEWVNKNHPELNTAWLCRTQELADEIRSFGYKAFVFGTKEADNFAKHAGVAFYSHELIDFGQHPRVGGSTIATTGHGSGGKKINYLSHTGVALFLKKVADYFFCWTYRDLTMATSKFHLYQYEGYFNLKKDAHKAICGQPQNDVLFSGLKKKDVLNGLGIDPNKNLVLYMPTYRGPAMGENHMAKIVKELYECKELDDVLNKTNSIFVVKLHPLTPRIDIANRDNFVILEYSALKNNHQLLAVGDMMISDYSATIVDFSLLERPVQFYLPDHEDFMRLSEPLFDEFVDLCKRNCCTTPKELANAILHPSMEAVGAINEMFEDPSLKGTCFCEGVFKAICKEAGLKEYL